MQKHTHFTILIVIVFSAQPLIIAVLTPYSLVFPTHGVCAALAEMGGHLKLLR